VAFSGNATAGSLAAAFGSLAADCWVTDVRTAWFSGEDGCAGQLFSDGDHFIPRARVTLAPELGEDEVAAAELEAWS
jgi:hypothetical protein